jgi:hypothetical protein
MTGIDFIALLVLLLFISLLIFFISVDKRWPAVFRPIKGYEELGRAIERAVEAGERVHVSLGTGSAIGSDSAPAYAGLVMLRRVGTATTMSDKPAVVTTGDGALMILAQETLRSVYARAGALDRYHPFTGKFLGPTPYAYVATLPSFLSGEQVSTNVYAGSFGTEGAWASDLGYRQGSFTLAGTDDVQSQALLYAAAQNPLIGEEVFAGGAYLNVGTAHRASLRVQDTIRIVVIVVILAGTALKIFGVGL